MMITEAPEETRAYGNLLAKSLQAGDVVLLVGDLGAGKSELTRGIAKGLGVTETVTSPTFTILNVYESGKIPLYHFDWYRLQDTDELYDMGMDEYLGGDGIAVVEWPERCEDAIPGKHLIVRINTINENTREIILIPQGGFRDISPEE